MTFRVQGANAHPDLERFIARKAVVPSSFRTEDWADVPAEFAARSLFSSGVEDAQWLARQQAKLLDAVAQRKEQVAGGEAFVTRSSFVADLRRDALERGLSDGTGRLTDVASARRLRLIYDMQTRQAQGYARRKADHHPDRLLAFPAQELIRREGRQVPRDWEAVWGQAGGVLPDGRMVALKTDPIWARISRFGTPWPPFDFGSGMGLRDIGRGEAIRLGILEPEDRPEFPPEEAGFMDNLELDASDIDDVWIEALVKLFGTLIERRGRKLAWRGAS